MCQHKKKKYEIGIPTDTAAEPEKEAYPETRILFALVPMIELLPDTFRLETVKAPAVLMVTWASLATNPAALNGAGI